MASVFSQIPLTSLLILLLTSICHQSIATDPTVYDLLRAYDFPVGILPKGVTGYNLDSSSGKFSVFWNNSCSFSLEGSYQLRYKPVVNGYISKGKLSGLEGVSVKLFFIWVNIIEVLRNGDDLEFSVGITGAGFPLDNFEESPQCGCGFDCGDKGNQGLIEFRVKRNTFVSSI